MATEPNRDEPWPSEGDVERALMARVPGGSEVWCWLPQKDAWTPHQTARDVMRAALLAASPPPLQVESPELRGLMEAAVAYQQVCEVDPASRANAYRAQNALSDAALAYARSLQSKDPSHG